MRAVMLRPGSWAGERPQVQSDVLGSDNGAAGQRGGDYEEEVPGDVGGVGLRQPVAVRPGRIRDGCSTFLLSSVSFSPNPR